MDAVLEPLPDFVTADRPAAYRPVPWTEFMGTRVAGERRVGCCLLLHVC